MLIAFSTLSAHSIGRDCTDSRTDLPPALAGLACAASRRRRITDQEPTSASYSRYSSDNQNESSVSDQQRTMRESAEREGHPTSPRYEYVDEAVSGTLLKREGLNRLLRDAEAGLFNVLYFFNLSRLARESVISMPLLKNLVYNFGVRIISCKEGVDSDRDGWEVMATFCNLNHEQFIRDLSDNVKKGQQGTVLARFSIGDWRFGYESVPSPGGEMIRRGGDLKPRKVYQVKEAEAHWVRQIFQWFAREERSLGWIVKELNRQAVPRDRRATTSRWHSQVVVRMLRSTKYIGLWPWGERESMRNPLTGVVRAEPRPPEECQKWLREFPELRVIDDDTFDIARRRLDAQADQHPYARRDGGRLRGTDGSNAQRHRLFRCGGCQSTLICGGGHGDYLLCPGFRQGLCRHKAMMPRRLAERLLLDLLAERILRNEAWFEAVYQSTLRSWRESSDNSPGLVEAAHREVQQLDQKIGRLIDQVENAAEPDPGLTARLAERRRERTAAARRLQELEATVSSNPNEPTREHVRERLAHLHEVLTSAAPVANTALKVLLNAPIVLETVTVPGRERSYWRGTLQLTTSGVIEAGDCRRAAAGPNAPAADSDSPQLQESITLDFVRPLAIDRQVVRAWELLQAHQPLKEIARQLGVRDARMTVIMKVVAERYGNGLSAKALREQYRPVNPRPKAVEAYIERAMQLVAEGKLLGEIADELGTHRNMITKAVRSGYAARGLTPPDGRTRRKSLDFKGRSPWESRRPTPEMSSHPEDVLS
ncbi:MAG: recombinase family protein [Planctomycetaceae bacterium]|nr:recombinase family protein [Planctomycetaceae bacterium]